MSQWQGLTVLRFRKNEGVKTVILEECIANADFGKDGADQILAVAQIALIVDPPGDGLLSVKRRIIPVDVFRDRLGNITGVFDACLRRGAIGTGMAIKLMTGDVVGVPLGGLANSGLTV